MCGNGSSGEGGGVVHLGEIQFGDIEHNSIVLNQSDNPTIPTNGGGIQVMGTPDTDPICGTQLDSDCPPGLSDGTGHGLTINANLIQANMAESGSGGGIRLQQVNGTEISTFPNTTTIANNTNYWNSVSITNNIIVNNVAGWDGGGISLQDSLNVSIVNNTIASNDTLASSGVLTQSLGTPSASAPAGNCVQAGGTTSCPQSAGVTSTQNSSIFTTSLTGLTITCPTGQPGCQGFSNPLLQNNVIWQNRSFDIGVAGLGAANLNQQNQVALFTRTGAAAPTQTASGQCGAASYWDIGVRGDTAPGNHSSGFSLNPTYSVLDDTGYASTNLASNPSFVTQYCNGSRVPPECTAADGCGGPSGYGVPPGIADALTPNPVFTLAPAATVDEGNNWINVSWGPLALSNDALTGGANGNYGGGTAFGNYVLVAGSPAVDYVPVAQPHPTTDFFGNPRPDSGNPNAFNVGAVESTGTATAAAVLSVTGGPVAFGSVNVGTTSAPHTLTLSNTGTAAATAIAVVVTAPFSQPAGAAGGTCTATLAAGATCTINVVFTPTTTGAASGTATITANVPVTGSPVALSGTGTGVAPLAVSVAPTSLTFASTTDGTTSASQSVTVTATGAGTFTFSSIAITAPFARAAAGGSCAGSIASPFTCTISVVFSPTTQTGTVTGSLTITGNVPVTGSPVTLTGTAAASTGGAVLSVTGGPLTFNTALGTTSASQTLTLHNTGTGGATGIALTFAPAAFSRPGGGGGGTCGATLAAATTCTINVHFTAPTTPGTTTGTLTIAASVGVTGSPVSLTGNSSTATVTVTPATLAFGSHAVGTTSAAMTFTINNTSALVSVAAPTVGAPFTHPGGGAGGTCGGTIAAGTTCTYNVTFAPTAAQAYNVPLTFAAGTVVNTGTGANMTGTGVSVIAFALPNLTTTPATTTTKTGTVTVTYAGAGTFTFTAAPSIARVGGTNGTFSITGGTCDTTVTSLSANGTCTINVQFVPATGVTTTRNADVTVTGTATGFAAGAAYTSVTFPAN